MQVLSKLLYFLYGFRVPRLSLNILLLLLFILFLLKCVFTYAQKHKHVWKTEARDQPCL